MDEIVAHSRALIEKGSKSFAGAARLFPERTRHDAYMLYAWCRHCDDAIDGQELGFRPAATALVGTGGETAALPDGRASRAVLASLEAKTRRAIAGDADEPVFAALARVVQANDIPSRHPLDHLAGFEMDVDGRVYATVDDTLDYCYHVAGVVGVMMAYVMGVRDAPTLARASDLGIAFQLTNICRDVIDDAAAGRVYLPADWLAEAGVGARPQDLLLPASRPGVTRTAHRLLALAERYYASAGHGIDHLPFRCAWAIAAAKNVYRDIGRRVQAEGDDAWKRRAVVGRSRKLIGVALAGIEATRATVAPRKSAPPRADLWTHPAIAMAAGPSGG